MPGSSRDISTPSFLVSCLCFPVSVYWKYIQAKNRLRAASHHHLPQDVESQHKGAGSCNLVSVCVCLCVLAAFLIPLCCCNAAKGLGKLRRCNPLLYEKSMGRGRVNLHILKNALHTEWRCVIRMRERERDKERKLMGSGAKHVVPHPHIHTCTYTQDSKVESMRQRNRRWRSFNYYRTKVIGRQVNTHSYIHTYIYTHVHGI